MSAFEHRLLILTDARKVIRGLIRRLGASYTTRLRWDADPYPNYGYSLWHAATQAAALGLPAISAIELGVAGGNGLVALEDHAEEVEELTGVRISTFGFDTGSGMPPAQGVKDLPYVWRPGYFEMDDAALRHRLRRSELVMGDVRDTVPEFMARTDVPPIGFISIDLDYHSSTVAALRLLEGPSESHLPRTFCHLDDIVGGDAELHSRFAGELLAVEEFNAAHEDRKLAPIHGLRYKRMLEDAWHEKLYVLHDFGHRSYATHLGPADWQLELGE